MVIPRTWIRKAVVFYLIDRPQGKWGQSRCIDDDQIQRKQTSSLPSHESIVPRNGQKQRRWENYLFTSVPMEMRLKLFFAQLFLLTQLSIYGAVSDLCDECKSCHVTTGRLVLM